MYASHSCPTSPADSVSNLSVFRSGYVKLPTCVEEQAKDRGERGSDYAFFPPRSTHPKSKTCVANFLSFLYRFFVAFLRLLCFRLPRNLDNESLLNVDHKRESKAEEQACRISYERGTLSSPCIYSKKIVGVPRQNYVVLLAPNSKVGEKLEHAAVDKIRESQVRSEVIASKGKGQLTALKVAVTKSKQELQQVKDDVSNIRGNIEAAKKIFSEVEKGIRDYKWDAFTRDTWTAFEYQGELCYFPISQKSKYHDPFKQMYSDHRIFIEEMKFHFKWNHGVML